MASPATLDIAALLPPIPGDEPAGAPVRLPVRQKLDAARKESEPHPDDPSLGEIPKKADWPGIVGACQGLLTKGSKDLLLAARMTEALTRLHGFAGLRDGLHLLHDLVDQCWDRVHPIPEEDEGIEIRAGPFHWLSDADRGARFPHTVRDVPLVAVNGAKAGWLEWKRSQEGRGQIPQEDFARAVPATPDTAADLAEAVGQLDRLDQALAARLGDNAPGMVDLRQALEECRQFMDIVVRRQAPVASAEASAANGAAGAGTAEFRPLGASLQTIATREEAYRQLGQIAGLLEQLEPHSPIPDLLRRAIELGRMPFRQLVQELVRDPNHLAELRREFGIRPPPERA